MISKALDILKNDLSDYLLRQPDLAVSGDVVCVSPVVDGGGAVVVKPESLGICLVNVEEERALRPVKSASVDDEGRVSHFNPDIRLNLYILVVAHFGNYDNGLRFLSGAVRFFQGKGVFTHQNTPGLDPALGKLVVELHTLGLEQQNHLWGALGAKYMPSVAYKVRLLTVQDGRTSGGEPAIAAVGLAGRRA